MSEAVERAFAEVLRAEEPVEAWRARAAADPSLAALARYVTPNGLTMAAILVLQLRYERLVRGSAEAMREDRDAPAEFARAFRRYHAEVAPTALLPPGEAQLWAHWRERND